MIAMDHVALLDPRAMHRLVGARVRYQGERWRIGDVLPEEGMLVLVAEDDEVQDDAYGRPHRLTPRTIKLHVRTPAGAPTEHWRELELIGLAPETARASSPR
ncbi:MAG: hypothetical protein D6771_00985 [Zetaproteobacteria bacterium]|nr:MAG: hypothetical protein D6771_00985 [Zetaproteobacteria bacterium]